VSSLLLTVSASLVLGTSALAAVAIAAPPAYDPAPDAARQQVLIHMVRQDCGSCHGMKLTGGLGPALTREAMANLPLESLAATIFHGRPGTPMPPWNAMLNEAEARWIAVQLQQGFPEEHPARQP
jgi:cytochrome c55X